MINIKRMACVFSELVQIDSVSKEEAKIADRLSLMLESLGAEVVRDRAGEGAGGNASNIVARFSGNVAVSPMLLCAHMDTVEPGRGVKPVSEEGVFTSSGDTILGADDKSAIAILIEVLTVLKESHLSHGPLEVVLTVCEEIGLLGAKYLDMNLVTARFGYALDGSDTEGVITRAPAANRLEFKIHGKDAHAGAAPEKGINAILLAAKAISQLEIGRIDQETTCNIGIIEGGNAVNVVPNLVVIKGEVRSHDPAKLDRVTGAMISCFQKVVDEYPKGEDHLPRLEVAVIQEFPRTHIPDDDPGVLLAGKAAKTLGRSLKTKISGGGSDANVFFEKGIMVGVLGTGMRDMHTVRESVSLEDMAKTAELLLEIIKLHGEER
ncbi:MAG: M20/M25/M40 family metallo-hydrolase [Proteobacteria bacterium]|nr:M20/M25/M40 family metallo-hydrolase [Pseudomonadota bacterium]MBU4470245.1 M20/M25/M40 family metallo-hydrolase [Pseudomonadota bacterium]MCG2752660.1 M20/M25/M40 family metallo-hydrolase [Desulfobacteraceae bacterium]